MPESSPQEAPREPPVGAIEEYGTLRSELTAIEGSRLRVIGVSTLAAAALAAFGISGGADRSTGVAALVLLVLLAGALMTARLSERIHLIRVYLARYVEPILPGAKWEQRRLELEEITARGWLPKANEQTVAALVYLGGAAITLIVYFGGAFSRPVYGEILTLVLAALVGAAALRLIDIKGRNAGQRGWDTFETFALLGARAARPHLERLLRQLLPRARRLERLREDLPMSAKVPPFEQTDDPAAAHSLRWHSGLSQEEFDAVLAAKRGKEALSEVVDLLFGGLGPEGMATWLRTGEPSRLDYLRRGKSEPVLAEARAYVDFPPQAK